MQELGERIKLKDFTFQEQEGNEGFILSVTGIGKIYSPAGFDFCKKLFRKIIRTWIDIELGSDRGKKALRQVTIVTEKKYRYEWQQELLGAARTLKSEKKWKHSGAIEINGEVIHFNDQGQLE